MDTCEILTPVDNTQMEGIMSQNLYKGPSFHFMIKNGKRFVIVFFYIYSLFHKVKNNTSIKILRHSFLHMYHENS